MNKNEENSVNEQKVENHLEKYINTYKNKANNNEKETSNEQLLIYTVTYNIHGNMPDDKEIPLLFPKKEELNKFDIFVINTQECLRSISASFFVNSKEPWVYALKSFFGNNYENIINSNLGALHISIFVKKEKVMHFHDLRSGEIKTGFLNLMANKGAVSASMKCYDKNILFISCHLASGQNNQVERNNSLYRIGTSLSNTVNKQSCNRLKTLKKTMTLEKNKMMNEKNDKLKRANSFEIQNIEEEKKSNEANSQNDKETNKNKENENNEDNKNIDLDDKNENIEIIRDNNKKEENEDDDDEKDKSIEDYDFVIMSGDFNYRLDIKEDEVNNYMVKNDPEILWEKDQFTTDIKEKNNYREGIINFMPTYKYKELSNEYDYSRIPGWTDRILYKSKDYYDIMLCEYSSIQNINISDHKPVYAVFKINCKISKDPKVNIPNRVQECNII